VTDVAKHKPVTASQLGSACVCEQQSIFDIEHGLRRTPEQMEQVEGGIKAHERLHTSARTAYANVETSVSDRRCFLASCLFGSDAPETNRLRTWRDATLMKTVLGRLAVALYYHCSPVLVKAMDRSELLRVTGNWAIQKLLIGIARGGR
jgi:hypothetical protein